MKKRKKNEPSAWTSDRQEIGLMVGQTKTGTYYRQMEVEGTIGKKQHLASASEWSRLQ